MSEDTKKKITGTEDESVQPEESFESKIEKAMEKIVSETAGEEESKVPPVRPPQSDKVPPKKKVQAQQQPRRQVQHIQPPPKKRNPGIRITCTLLAAIIFAGCGAYLGMSYYYSNKFFPGTVINSFECGDMTVTECEDLIRSKVEDYSLVVKARGQEDQKITAESIDYEYKSDGAVQKALNAQKPLEWIKGYFIGEDYLAGENVSYDKEKVREQLEQLNCMKAENQVQPEDARIEFKDTLFEIVPGQEGSAVNEEKALELLYSAIESTEQEVDLEAGGAYQEPNVRADDESLIERLKIVNNYAKASITHTFGDETEVLNGATIKDWYSTDENGDLYLDGEVLKERLREYVANMAYRHDTLGSTRSFYTTSGRTVQVSGGSYGWQIAQYDEVEKMYTEILTGQQVTREPIYSSTANAAGGSSDIGNTYVEVDLSAQHLYFYRNGSSIFDSEFVSGNMSYSDRMTPEGVCRLTYKTKDFTLRGEKKADGTYEYEEPVSYWMPFNGGVGFHDAPWRSEFGGSIYKTSGSHGCINMPFSKAAELYNLIDDSIPIVVFY